jgi:hypothetical protein
MESVPSALSKGADFYGRGAEREETELESDAKRQKEKECFFRKLIKGM